MEKKLYDLSIDEELESLIPPLQEVELKMLTESLLENGCEMPLVVWNDVIVDGHNRYRICRENGIPFAIEEKDFESREAAKIWLIKNQLGRRNLPEFLRVELVLPLEALEKEKARKRQGERTDLRANIQPNLARSPKPKQSRDEMARMAGVSHGTYDKAKKIMASADEETKDKLRKGEMSIHKAYKEMLAAEKADSPANHTQTEKKSDDIPTAEESVAPAQDAETVHESTTRPAPALAQEPIPEPEPTLDLKSIPKQDKPIVPKSYKDLFSRPVFSRDQPLCVVKEPIPFEPVVSAARMAAFEAEKRERERKASMEVASASPDCAAATADSPEETLSVEEDLRDLIEDFLEDLSEVLTGMTSGNAASLLEMVQSAGERAVHKVKEHMKKMEEQ